MSLAGLINIRAFTVPSLPTINEADSDGVVDVDTTGGGDTLVNSALLIDNIRLTTPSTPEPSTIIGLLMLGGMAIASKKYSS